MNRAQRSERERKANAGSAEAAATSNQQLATSNQQWRQWRPVCELAHTHMHRHSRPQLRLFSAEDRSLCARMGAHQAHRLRIRSERMKLCKRRPVCVCVCVCAMAAAMYRLLPTRLLLLLLLLMVADGLYSEKHRQKYAN